MHSERGLTLIELLTVSALLAVLLAIAVPSFNDFIGRRRVEGVATELMMDLKFARSQSIDNNANVELRTSGTGYDVSNGASPPTYFRRVTELPGGVGITSSVTVTFTSFRGFPNSSQITVSSTQTSGQLRVAVDALGVVTICSPSGLFSGYTEC